MKDKKAGGNDDIPGDVLKLLGEDCLRIMRQLVYNMQETGEWFKDFTEVRMVALKKTQRLQNEATVAQSALSYIHQRGLRRKTERKIEDAFGEY